ncbi:MAG: hypothetical protein JNJ87_11455 [Acinetobacter junii]|nr:hypothetical protein [Acinetobacter junii]
MNHNEIQSLITFLEFILKNSRVLRVGITVSDGNFSITDTSLSLVDQIESNVGTPGKEFFLKTAESLEIKEKNFELLDIELIKKCIEILKQNNKKIGN